MAELSINRDDILQSTLFHIQVNSCQFIDAFPEKVTAIFSKSIDNKRLLPYDRMKRRLYRMNTSFFEINKTMKKRDFYQGLYKRIKSHA